jgi:hypothetical protein
MCPVLCCCSVLCPEDEKSHMQSCRVLQTANRQKHLPTLKLTGQPWSPFKRFISDLINSKTLFLKECISNARYLLGGQSKWLRGLRRRSAAQRLLGSKVRILWGAWMSVSCECLCSQVEVSATGWSLVQRSPTDCGVCLRLIKWK